MRITKCARLFLLDPLTDAEHVSVRMPHVHLPHVPRHVGWRPCHFESLLQAVAMDAVDIGDPDRHPDTLVSGLIAARAERRPRRTFAAATLTAFAKKDLGISREHAAESRRLAPVPSLFPSELLEPRETLLN